MDKPDDLIVCTFTRHELDALRVELVEAKGATLAHLHDKCRRYSQADDDDSITEALSALRREYYSDVASYALDLLSRCSGPDADIRSSDELSDAIYQMVDGSQWIIYTARNMRVLMLSDNSDAYDDELGEVPTANTFAVMAFYAMKHDIEQHIAAEGTPFDAP